MADEDDDTIAGLDPAEHDAEIIAAAVKMDSVSSGRGPIIALALAMVAMIAAVGLTVYLRGEDTRDTAEKAEKSTQRLETTIKVSQSPASFERQLANCTKRESCREIMRELAPRGTRGPEGDRGPRGRTGDRGSTGARGPAGSAGARGSPGGAGGRGAPGANGQDGAPGDPGLPGIPGQPGTPGLPCNIVPLPPICQ